MKTKLILALSAALALGLTACGDDDDDKDNGNQSACTSAADCAGRADGKTECDAAKKECVAPAVDAPECTSAADCAGRTDGRTECDAAKKECVAPEVEVPPDPPAAGNIKISQIYLAGFPTIGSKYNASYIELFNAGTQPIDAKNYSVVYGKSAVTDIVSLYDRCANDNCVMPAGGYLLIKVKSNILDGAAELEAADVDLGGNPNIGIDGTYAIVHGGGLSGSEANCDTVKAAVDDLVAIGENAWCHEGSGNATGISTANRADQAYLRKGNGCTDTDDNAADFEVAEASPRNSKSAAAPCSK